jgi:hypothetical protein
VTSPPEIPGELSPRHRRSLLGVVAYVLVSGERRRRAAGHFRKAGFEALRGVGELARLERSPESGETGRRERIEIE